MANLRFFNVWEAHTPDAQRALIDVMRRETSIFVGHPGFVSLRGWVSETDNRVIAEATWASRSDFEAAVSQNLAAQAGRERMQILAREAPAVFTLAFTHLPDRDDPDADDTERSNP